MTSSLSFDIKEKYMFIVGNLDTVEEYREEIKISCCYHLTSQCKHFGAFPSELL